MDALKRRLIICLIFILVGAWTFSFAPFNIIGMAFVIGGIIYSFKAFWDG